MENQDNEGNVYRPTIIIGKDLDRYFDLQKALFEFSRLFNEEKNDRAIAIVGATFLEMVLEHILRAFLIDSEKDVNELFQPDKSLGTFSSKIKMVYCLGLIYKPARDDLDLVRKIRNEFAHNLYASFEDQKIKSWCSNLKWHLLSYISNPPGTATSRDLFQVGTNQLICYLNGVVGIARSQKRKIENYPE